jgi:hypothetical protein
MLFKEFRDLRQRPDLRIGMPDLLNYAFFGGPDVIVLKDGALMACFAYRGPDLNSASPRNLGAQTPHQRQPRRPGR